MKTNKKSEGEKIKDGLKNEESDWCNSEIINKIRETIKNNYLINARRVAPPKNQ